MIVQFANQLKTPDALRAFLKQLLDGGSVDAVLVACASPHSPLPMPTLVSDPLLLDRALPLAPAAPFNAARLAARVLAQDAGKRIAVVLRPCEVRALIELEKLNQCTRKPAVVISMDCFGRMENDRYLELAASIPDPEGTFLASDDRAAEVCPSCQACLRFTPRNVDLTICLAGHSTTTGVTLMAETPIGEGLLKKTNAPVVDPEPDRAETLGRIQTLRKARHAEMTASAAVRMADPVLFQQTIANCLNCYNCRTACPVCYCKTCVFSTDVFAHRAEILLGRAAKKGAVKIPTDTTMFHMTRMAHMAHACVGCGQCSSVCPSRIPVADLFITMADQVQAHYDYIPGEDPGRPWPVLMDSTTTTEV